MSEIFKAVPFSKALIPLRQINYLMLITCLAPALNFLAGLNIDIYAPSMPTMAKYFMTSVTMLKYTVAMSVLGIAIGSLIFGGLMDAFGRKPLLVFGVFVYFILTILTPLSSTIHEVILLRFLQGMMISCVSIGCRALIVDNMEGHRYKVAILYTSIGYGLGPVIGPFVGGWLQLYFGWGSCFYALTAISLCLLVLLVLFIEEKQKRHKKLRLNNVYRNYHQILRHKKFMAGAVILGLAQIELLSYPTLGPFVVENILKHSVLMYSNTALLVGLSYLIGSLVNRFLLNHFKVNQIIPLGVLSLGIGLMTSYLFLWFFTINMFTLCLPIMIVCFSVGLLFSNIMGENVKLFSNTAGIAMAVLAALLTGIAALGITVESLVHVHSLAQLALLYAILIFLQVSLICYRYDIGLTNFM